MKLSKPANDLLMYIYSKKEVTNSKSGLHQIQFYTLIWHLRNIGLVECIGKTDKNEKKWVLSDKGEKIANHLNEINKIYEGEKNEG